MVRSVLKDGNGYIREYYVYHNILNIILFEGEYKNGMANGKAKLYETTN